jgi:hypothetical protein
MRVHDDVSEVHDDVDLLEKVESFIQINRE